MFFPALYWTMPFFSRRRDDDRRLDEILSTLRTFDARLTHVETYAKPQTALLPSTERLDPMAAALGRGLEAMANVLPELVKGQLDLSSRLSERVVKNSLSATASDLGRRSGEKRREKAAEKAATETAVALTEQQQHLAACANDCEDCAAQIEKRGPRHTNDMIRHVRD